MNSDSLPKRKRNRLHGFDYGTEGCYFITLCTNNRQQLFRMEHPVIVGNDLCVVPHDLPLQNRILRKWIKETEQKFQTIRFDNYIIMPDHIHFIVNITERHAGRSLQDAMRFFKAMTTNEYIRAVKNGLLPTYDKKIWQKSYYDHIIRNEQDYIQTIQYIANNPEKWMLVHEKNRDG